MVNSVASIEAIGTNAPADCALSETALEMVVGGRMKQPGPEVRPSQGQGGTGLPFGEWAQHPNYLPF